MVCALWLLADKGRDQLGTKAKDVLLLFAFQVDLGASEDGEDLMENELLNRGTTVRFSSKAEFEEEVERRGLIFAEDDLEKPWRLFGFTSIEKGPTLIESAERLLVVCGL